MTQADSLAPGQAKDAPDGARRAAVALWARYLGGRLAGAVAVLAVVAVATFLIVRLVPGDPARNIAGITARPGEVARVRQQLGLTGSVWQQFGRYTSGLVRGNLGTSFVDHQPISQLIAQRLSLTAQLAAGALAVVLVIGFPLGIIAGWLQHHGRARVFGTGVTAVSSLAGAMPEYITGTLLIFVFALTLHLLPVQGGAGFTGMLMPALAVGLAPAAVFARLVRNETVTVLSQEYIATAMSKRLPALRLAVRHVLPNVATSTLTLGGLLLVALLGGTVITENVFNISGLGTGIVQSILHADYPAVQGILLVLAVIAVVINLAVDIALGLLDPRVLMRRQT